MNDLVRTSDKEWLEKAMRLYAEKTSFRLEDDAGLKITQEDLISAVALIKAAKKKGSFSWQQIIGALTGMGISYAGVCLVAAAVYDPEPTSKLGLLVGGGILITLTGGLGALAALDVRYSVALHSPNGHVFKVMPKK